MNADELMLVGLGLLLAIAITLPYVLHHRRREQSTREAEARARELGLDEPVTMHPVVDPSTCIGTANCISVCPEGDVLGLRNGQATPVNPARCIGHGLCERSCPVEAIQLAFGSERRGVDIPRIQENFETNVPGIYIIGELGGMGLIRNAFEQGRQCIEGIARESRRYPSDVLDVFIIGCGPAGLAASLHALDRGMRFVTIDKEDVGGTVRTYPRKKIVMTAPVKIPGYKIIGSREIAKEALVDIWNDVIAQSGLQVNTGEIGQSVVPAADECFEISTNKRTYLSRRVILAIGRRGVPRKLGVPGENLPNVFFSLGEHEVFENDRVIVVGGGDSAVEAALAIASQSNSRVRLSYRGERFGRIKPANLHRLEDAVEAGRITLLLSTHLFRIMEDAVEYQDAAGDLITIPNDFVLVMIGGELPTAFLRSCGVKIDTKFGEPVRRRR